MATIDEPRDALRESVELLLVESREHTKQIDKLAAVVAIDAENIRALARIAEAHQSRLTNLEGAR